MFRFFIERIRLSLLKNIQWHNFSYLLLFLLVFIHYTGPLWDIDLWWHLAEGRSIFENKSLLDNDPFLFTSEIFPPQKERIAPLNGYWLAQILFYLVHQFFGDYGMIFFRAAILMSVVLLGFYFSFNSQLNEKKENYIFILPWTIAAISLSYFSGTRPAFFSFLFAIIVFHVLEQMRLQANKGKFEIKKAVFLSAIMLIWANMHRGVIMGLAIISITILSEIILKLYKKDNFTKQYRYFIYTGIISFLTAGICPNHFSYFYTLIFSQSQGLTSRVTEYLSPFTLLLNHNKHMGFFWLFFISYFVVIIYFQKRIKFSHFVITFIFGLMSLVHSRVIPFFVIIGAYILCIYIPEFIKKEKNKQYNIFAFGLAFLFLFLSLLANRKALVEQFNSPLAKNRYPENALQYIRHDGVQKNIFNHFNWGGYLEYHLYPNYKFFIDGRNLNLRVFSDYTYILWDEINGKKLLNFYKINTVIIPYANPFTGEPYKLVQYMKKDKNWHTVFADETSIIFERKQTN